MRAPFVGFKLPRLFTLAGMVLNPQQPQQQRESWSQIFGGPLARINDVQPAIVSPSVVPPQHRGNSDLKLVSWNLLATPYCRPREALEEGLARGRAQVAYVAEADADVIGLQEFWCGSSEYIEMWRAFAADKGYFLHLCPRVNGKQDGCALLIRAACCVAEPEFYTYHYDDWGSRVVQVAKIAQMDREPLMLVNTHLTFPHDSDHDPAMRREQARKLSELIRCQTSPTVLFGDMNTPCESDAAIAEITGLGGCRPQPPASAAVTGGAADGKWYSHMAHTGALMPCDLVFTRGACEVAEWSLGGSVEALVARELPSDHRPLHATISRSNDEQGTAPGTHDSSDAS